MRSFVSTNLHFSSDYIDIIDTIYHAQLCVYGLAHTCTPLLILLLLLLLFHARLCVYGLAHTCTPLLINIFHLARLCVYGLAHTCTPLQIN